MGCFSANCVSKYVEMTINSAGGDYYYYYHTLTMLLC